MSVYILKQSDFEALTQIKAHSSLKDSHTLNELSAQGPVVLNFILGTWCPLCLNHIKAIAGAVNQENLKIVVVSSESLTKLDKEFTKEHSMKLNGLPIMFCSDSSRTLINMFKLRVPVFGFSKPATFLLSNNQVKMISEGIPNKEQTVCDLSYYLKQSA